MAKNAILVRMGELHNHLCAVAARSKSPAELRMRLIRDGTILDEPVIEWYDRDGHFRDMTHVGRQRSQRERRE